ncbi:MAG: NAD(P)H-dependent glycerol-3-phosphate dehydrogenase, partial [Acidobacteria bacterium]|nr:NAD(P)H-dependent glycerol-3-phosphate dehydrogenase [Acidobacteriota bacterium]
ITNLCFALEKQRAKDHSSIESLLEDCLYKNPYLKEALGECQRVSEPQSTYPVHTSRRRSSGEGFVLLGDAAYAPEPVTGEGVYFALKSANLASEVIDGQPTAAVIAMRDADTARSIQDVLMGPTFRIYTNDDVVGWELGGALKNVMAIAAGMSDGLGFGDNSRATLITRALAELTRLGVTLGGQPTTFAGLAGMGDLIATCSSTRSRNHRVGVGLAEGKNLDEIVAEMKMVAEGIKTTKSVLGLAARAGVEMPIAEHVGQVLHEGVHPRDAVLSLMTREARSEH